MWPNPQETADLVTFAEEILNGKLHFLCSEEIVSLLMNDWEPETSMVFGHPPPILFSFQKQYSKVILEGMF